MIGRTRVRVSISQDRRTEAERELREYGLQCGAGPPSTQGTDLIWDFTSQQQLSDAQMFSANARHTPGAHVYGPQPMTYAGAQPPCKLPTT